MIEHPPKRESYSIRPQGHSRLSFSVSISNKLHADLLEVCELNRNASINQAIAEWVAVRKKAKTPSNA
jgi:hypothetical protein